MPKKGENIYKRKDGRWEGRYIKARTSTGKIVYGYVYSKTYRETKIKLKEKVPILIDLPNPKLNYLLPLLQNGLKVSKRIQKYPHKINIIIC